MATVKGALALYDGMTGPLKNIHDALNIVLNSFEAVQSASENVVDVSAIQQAREELARAGATWDNIENTIRDADRAQDDFNNRIRDGTSAADGLGNRLKGILATVISIAGVKSALNWGKENFALANTQRNAENQLKLVLANMGAQDVEIPVNTTADDAATSLQACADAVNQLDGAKAEIGVENSLALNTKGADKAYSNFAKGLDGSTLQNTLALDTNEAAALYEELTGAVNGNTLENTLALDVAGANAAYDDLVGGVLGDQITIGIRADTTQTMSAFDAIAAKASEIQGRGIYGDEAMIAGAAELATYFSDTEAILSMMDTLSNYAMGMSGGGELDATAMVDYATNIGKIMTGAYDAMTKKGFQFTDAQKAVIEGTATHAQYVEALGADYTSMSEEMRAAAVIDNIISESWNGLYESMSNTPEGKMIQFNNTLGDLRETMGNRLYPAALHFFDVFTQKFPQIEQVLTRFTDGLSILIMILTQIASAALDVATFISDNWGWLGPIILGVAGAYIVLHGAMLAYNTIQAISNGIEAVKAARLAMTTVAQGAQTTATFAATAAQYGLNAALLACPITWIIIGIIAIIAALYAAVGAVNHFAGTSVSATGIIGGTFAVLGAHIINTFIVPFWNALAAIANFIGNVFNNPVAAVKVLFYDMALTVVGYIKNMAETIENLINKIPGVQVDITSGLDNFYSGLEKAQQEVKDESGWVEYVHKMDFIDYGEAASAGDEFGQGLEDTVSGLFKAPTLDELGLNTLDTANLGNNLDGIYGNTGDTAANTAATADALDYTEEDLKYLRDIAEREAINRYTTAQITVEQTNHNNISGDTDLDGIMDAWANDFAERLDISEEGVHE